MIKTFIFFKWLVIFITIFLSGCSEETYFFNRGNREARDGNYGSAIKFYNEGLKINPHNVDIYYNRGLAWDYKGDFNNAKADYTKALELKGDFRDAFHSRGLLYKKNGNYDLAIYDFTKALQLNPDPLQKYQLIFNRAYAWYKMSLFDEAIDGFSEAIKIHEKSKFDPKDLPGIYYYRAEAWYEKGNIIKSILDYTIAIQKKPDFYLAIFHRGDRFYEKKDYEAAINDYENGIKLNPKDPVILSNYSWLLSTCPESKYRNGNIALNLALKANELKPNEMIILSTLAAAYAENRDFGRAVQIQTKAISLLKDDNENLKSLKAELKTELKYFKAGKPWRESIKHEDWMKNYTIK